MEAHRLFDSKHPPQGEIISHHMQDADRQTNIDFSRTMGQAIAARALARLNVVPKEVFGVDKSIRAHEVSRILNENGSFSRVVYLTDEAAARLDKSSTDGPLCDLTD